MALPEAAPSFAHNERLFAPLFAMWDEWDQYSVPALYHYTTVAGLRGILRSKVLWSSDVLKMNDPMEFAYAARITDFVLKNRWNELPVRVSNFFNPLGLLNLGQTWRAYGASFCARKDQLGQWWRYGDAGRGVALEFHLDTLLEYAQQTKHFALVPLRYDPVRLMDVLDFTCELALCISNESVFTFDEANAFWLEACLAILNTVIRFKHPVYREEEEWRALSLRPSEGPCLIRRMGIDCVHYLELPIVESSLRRVVAGPFIDCSGTRELRNLLDASGFEGTEVVAADMPIR